MENEPWPESQTAKLRLAGKADINAEPMTTQSEVDAIANAMDNPQPVEEISASQNPNPPQGMGIDVSPEAEMQRMMQQYVRQNGGIVMDQNSDKKNGLILG